jgi:hypothetical protein
MAGQEERKTMEVRYTPTEYVAYARTFAERRLGAAQDTLVNVQARLRRAQVEALLGIAYDDEAMDRLILVARRARREADAAWAAGETGVTARAAYAA